MGHAKMVSAGLLQIVAMMALWPTLSQAPQASSSELDLKVVADEVADFLKRNDQQAIALGQFGAPPQMVASGGPEIARTLGKELGERGIQIKRQSELGIKGEYRLVEAVEPGEPAAQIRGQVVDRDGSVLFTFTRDLRDQALLASIFGATVDLPPSEGKFARERLLRASLEKPRVAIQDSTKASASATSPYAVEIRIARDGQWAPAKLQDEEGMAFTQIRRGETYSVNLINNSDEDAAVTLTIDGLNVFSFSEKSGYRYFIVPKKSQGLIKGWHRTNEVSDSFLVTEYSKSAVARSLPDSGEVGVITAQFAAAWPKDRKPPGDEVLVAGRGAQDATGRGPEIRANYKEVERTTGVLRSAISVRYTRVD